MAKLLGTTYRFDGESGRAVNTDHERIAQIIQDYNPDMRLVWIPSDQRQSTDLQPFAIVHSPLGRPEYIALKCREDEVNEKLLGRLIAGDLSRNDVLGQLEAEDKARELINAKKWEDTLAEKREIAAQIIKSPRVRYTYNGRVYE